MSLFSWLKRAVRLNDGGTPYQRAKAVPCPHALNPATRTAVFSGSSVDAWEDTPRISVEGLWAHIEASVPPEVFDRSMKLKADALRMKACWPARTYRFLCEAESAGLVSTRAMDELEAMLQEWA